MRGFAFGALLTGLLLCAAGCRKDDAPSSASAAAHAPVLDLSKERDIAYMIERDDHGKPVATPEDFRFKSGDRFRLRFRPGFAAYIYVVDRGNHEGTYHVLFPTSADRGRNPLAKGTAAVVPGEAEWLKMDQTAGDEYLQLIASTVELPELATGTEIGRDQFDAQMAEIERRYQPTSSRRFRDGDWTKFFAARDGDLALVVRMALRHE